jgi:hypothetical protein
MEALKGCVLTDDTAAAVTARPGIYTHVPVLPRLQNSGLVESFRQSTILHRDLVKGMPAAATITRRAGLVPCKHPLDDAVSLRVPRMAYRLLRCICQTVTPEDIFCRMRYADAVLEHDVDSNNALGT